MNNFDEFNENKNRKNTSIFYVVVSIITLVVALIGASFSYFIASSSSGKNDIDVGSAAISIDVNDVGFKLEYPDLIPADLKVVYYSVTQFDRPVKEDYDNYKTFRLGDSDITEFDKVGKLARTKCRDDNGNGVCSIFTYKIKNSTDVSQDVSINLKQTFNNFTNLYMMILDEDMVEKDNFDTMTGIADIEGKTTDKKNLLLSSNVPENEPIITRYDDDENTVDYKLFSLNLGPEEEKTYSFVIYIKNFDDYVDGDGELHSGDQTLADSGKFFGGEFFAILGDGSTGDGKIFGRINEAWNLYNN